MSLGGYFVKKPSRMSVECSKMNGEDFKGSIPLDEARNAIFCQAIGLQGSLLHSVKMNYYKVRLISFELTSQIDIQDLLNKQELSFERKLKSGNNNVVDTIGCKILGICSPVQIQNRDLDQDQSQNLTSNQGWYA